MISGLQTLHQGRTTVVVLKLVTEGPPADLKGLFAIHYATNSWDHNEAGFLLLEKREQRQSTHLIFIVVYKLRNVRFRLFLGLWLYGVVRSLCS
ncbi:hypothetical protein PoB_006556700 [Plakobranchus ocellatus]|uniref:Uncharacterized protein n=1 Tax=Plakobranchus ocellatus TaxID=259542 RepID=A0AAV4D4C9_9GAST|nr:hypothetical protein PoB_006556700 [Plakobranchus ocellatus]